MVMLTLARFVLETTGGDSMPVVRDAMDRLRARAEAAPAAADANGVAPAEGEPPVGSGGDD